MEEWHTTPSGDACPWCGGQECEPFDDDDAAMLLCRGHLAEFSGLSLDGLDHMEREQRADMANLGMFDR